MKVSILVLLLILFSASDAHAQEDFVEFRAGITKDGLTYRYADYSHQFENGFVVDVSVYSEPGGAELWFGGGPNFKKGSFNHLIATYLVVGTSNGQLGLGLVYFAEGKIGKANVSYTTLGFIPFKGDVPKYLAVDSFDVTINISKKYELGVSSGAFVIGKDTNLIAGPVFKYNDKYGTTSISFRAGAYGEFRIGRTFRFNLFKKK